jgi:N-ethylmaleimide reductase
VHDRGGKIVCQIWHMGRLVHPDFLGGGKPVSASATTAPDQAHTYSGKKPYAEARALEVDEIPRLLADYERATANALAAGFDGVQIHAANGYLIDEFLRDGTNHRTDRYGGAIENRVRLLREVTEAVSKVAGPERTGVRLSPNGAIQGCNDSNPEPLFVAAAQALADIGIAFLEMREPGPDGTFGKADHPRQSGPRRADRPGRAPQQGQRRHVVQPGAGGLHRLPDPRGAASRRVRHGFSARRRAPRKRGGT